MLQLAQSESGNESVSKLFLEYKSMVFGLCLKYLQDRALAHDETMAVYEKLVKNIHKYEIGNFKNWLYTLSKNHCFEYLRKHKSQAPKINEAAIMYSNEIFHPDSSAYEPAIINKLKECMGGLSPQQRESIDMFYKEKLSYNEISTALELEWGSVRSLIQNGRRKPKLCMESK